MSYNIIGYYGLFYLYLYEFKNGSYGKEPQTAANMVMTKIVADRGNTLGLVNIYTILTFIYWFRIIFQFKTTRLLGPLVKILSSMLVDIMIFFMIFLVVIFMYICAGTVLFGITMMQFRDMWSTSKYLFSATLGNFNFDDFGGIPTPWFGELYMLTYLITTNIMLLNLLIAILSNTYAIFNAKSTALYLREIALLR